MTGKITPFRTIAPTDVVPKQVVSYEVSDIFPYYSKQERYNPDELVTRKGLRIYARMMDDEQVKAVMTFRKSSILARGWEFKYEEDSPLSEEERNRRIAFYQYNVRALRGSFQDALGAILRGHQFGFSLTEKVYDEIEFEGRPALGIVQLLPRDPAWFRFFTDKYGTLTKCEQWIGNEQLQVDLTKFVHYVRAPEEDRYYGQSDLKSAYRAWYIKDQVTKLYAIYLERFAGGFAYATLPAESSLGEGHADYAALQTALENIRNLASLILPPGVTLEVFTPASTGEYREALTYFDLAIAKAVLVPNLLGLSHTGQTGAFSQSQTQLEAYFMTTASDTARLEDAINEQLFKDLGDLNYGDGLYPRFSFKPASQEHVKWVVETFKGLVGGGVAQATEADEAHLRKLLDMPARTEEDSLIKEETLELEKKYAPEKPATPFTLEQLRVELDTRDTKLEMSLRDAIRLNIEPPPGLDRSSSQSSQDHTSAAAARSHVPAFDPRHGAPRAVDVVTFTRAIARVDFAVIERRHDLLATDAAEQVARTLARTARRALSDETLLGLLSEADVIGALSFDGADVGRVKSALKEALARAWAIGTEGASRELTKARTAVPATFASLRDRATDYFEANGFRLAANLTDGMRAIVQQELVQAIKTGARPEDVVARIYDRLIRKGFTTLTAVEREETRTGVLEKLNEFLAEALEVANVPAYLNTLVRTNTFEALNEARFAAFEDPALDGFVVAYEYSAILDANTTEICQSLDDAVYRQGSEVWDRYRPPNHYNCRSLLVPVFATDGWDGIESPAPTVEPQDGFK